MTSIVFLSVLVLLYIASLSQAGSFLSLVIYSYSSKFMFLAISHSRRQVFNGVQLGRSSSSSFSKTSSFSRSSSFSVSNGGFSPVVVGGGFSPVVVGDGSSPAIVDSGVGSGIDGSGVGSGIDGSGSVESDGTNSLSSSFQQSNAFQANLQQSNAFQANLQQSNAFQANLQQPSFGQDDGAGECFFLYMELIYCIFII
jgi:hypothetical protein